MNAPLHESAHYCTARALGFGDVRCEVNGKEGVTFFTRSLETVEERRRVLAVLVAAGLAEEIHGGRAGGGCEQDLREAAEILETFPAAERAQERIRAVELAKQALWENYDLLIGLSERLRDGGVFP